MNKKDQWLLFQRLSTLLEAGIPLNESVMMIRGRNVKNMLSLERLRTGIRNGKPLHELLKQDGSWSSVVVALIEVGELSGALSKSVCRATAYMKERANRMQKIFSAFVYPGVIALLATVIIFFLLVVIYPKVIPLFESMHATLPLSTRIIIYMSKHAFLIGSEVLFILGGSVFGVRYAYQVNIKARLLIQEAILLFPVVGRLLSHSELSELSFIISSLIESGMNISDSLQVARRGTYFLKRQEQLSFIRNEVGHGKTIFSSSTGFPDVWRDMVAVGERTGKLGYVLSQLSDLYRQETEETIAFMTKLVEPTLMIVVGVIVGFIAMSIISPMYTLTQYVHS